MVTRLNKLNAVCEDSVDDAVLLGESPAPASREFITQRLGLSYAGEGVGEYSSHEIDEPERSFTVGLNPIPQILAKMSGNNHYCPVRFVRGGAT